MSTTNCAINKTNGKPSALYNKLVEVLGSEYLAERQMRKIDSPKFIEKFGDWEANYKNGYENDNRLASSKYTNEDGEPYLHKKGNQYYFLLKNGKKLFINRTKFNNQFTPNEIDEIADQLLYEYTYKDSGAELNDYSVNNSNNIIKSIEHSLKSYVESFEEGEARDAAQKKADKILEFKDEFKQEIIDKIEDRGFRYKENITDEEGNPADEISEEEKAEGLNISDKFVSNSKDNATAKIKLLLSFIPDYEFKMIDGKNTPVFKKGKFLGKKKFIEFEEVWSTLEPRLVNIVGHGHGDQVVDVFDLMMDEIKAMRTIKPWTHILYRQLSKAKDNNDHNLINQFVQAFSMAKLNFYVTEYNSEGRASSYTIINATSTNSRANKVKNAWSNTFMKTYLDRNMNVKKEAIKDLETVRTKLRESYKEYLADSKKLSEDDAVRNNAYELLDTLALLGVDMKIEDLLIYTNLNAGKSKFEVLDDIYKKIGYMVNSMIDSKAEFTDAEKNFLNPLDQQSVIKELAEATAISKSDIAENTVLLNDGKTGWIYSNPTYVDNKVNTWKKDKSELEKLTTIVNNRNSRFLKFLLGRETDEDGNLINNTNEKRNNAALSRLANLEIGLSSTFKQKGKGQGADNKSIEFPDAILDELHKLMGSQIPGIEKSYYSTIVPADKSRKIQISGLPKEAFLRSGIDYIDGEWYIHPNATDQLIDYFEDEYNRMKSVYNELKSLPNDDLVVYYHTDENGNVGYYINDKGKRVPIRTFVEYEALEESSKTLVANGLRSQLFPDLSFDSKNLDPELRDSLYKDGFPITTDLNGLTDFQRTELATEINKNLIGQLKFNVQKLVDANIISIDKNNRLVNKKLDKRLMQAYGSSTSKVHAIIGDFFMNGFIASTEYSKLFSGDPAYYKNTSDLIKRIPATYTDGLQMRLSEKDHLYFNAAVITGVEEKSKYYELIEKSVKDKKIAEAYKKVNTTDAQAWITPQRWKFLMNSLGKWSDKHDDVYRRMLSGKKLRPAEMKIAMQPLKGVYFDINEGRPVYLKYSQAVLFPALVKGSSLQKMYDKMTKNADGGRLPFNEQIHEVITFDGVKVGAKGVNTIHKNGSTELEDNFELNPMVLSNRGWKLQQDLPTKLMKDTLVGSQVQKNILSGMVMNATYVHEGKEISGKDLMQKMHDTVSKLSNIGKDNLINRLKIVDGRITDNDALYDMLIEEYKQKGGNENIVAALEKEYPLDAIPQVRSKIQGMFMSIMNKELVKIKTNGGSFIQVSPFGLEEISDKNKAGIKIVSDNYDKEGLKPPHKDENGDVQPGQCFIPHSMMYKIIADYNSKKYKEDKKDEILNWDDLTPDKLKEILDPSALQLIGYRIPNQGMSSNDALEIVGILPPGMGDSIVAYDAVPGKTGSDFDIDKMFVMSHNILFNEKTGKIEKLTEDNKEFWKGKDAEKRLVQNELVELYYSVLTSEHTYDQMMKSIDANFFKNDIVGLFPEDSQVNLSLFNPVKQMITKFEYMSGKSGVAQTANQLVDHNLNQSLNIRFNGNIGIGHVDAEGNTKFDNLKDIDGNHTISDALSAFLNAYVDIAKDPYISRGNHNTITANTTFMLLRAGAPLEWVNRFMGQPILKEFVELTKNNQGITSSGLYDNKGRRVSPSQYIRAKYKFNKFEPKNKKHYASNLKERFKEDSLEKNIKNFNPDNYNDIDFRIDQQAILNAFETLLEYSKDFSASVLINKADTKGGGGNFTQRNIFENNIDEAFSKNMILGLDDKFKNTMLGTYTDNAIYWVGDVIAKSNLLTSGSRGMQDLQNVISSKVGKGKLKDIELGRLIEKNFTSYMMSGSKMFEGNRDNFDFLFKQLPIQVRDLKEKSDNFLIQELQLKPSKGYNFLTIDSRNKPKNYENRIYRAWVALLSSKDMDEVNLGFSLARYAYSQSGFQSNLHSFFSYIPHELFDAQDLDEHIETVFNDLNGDVLFDDKFFDQLVKHNYEDNKLVPQVDLTKNTLNYNIGTKSIIKGAGFIYNPESSNFPLSKGEYENGLPIYPAYVKTENKNEDDGTSNFLLYKQVGLLSHKGEYMPVYVRVNKLGWFANTGNIYEYQYGVKVGESAIPANNLPKETKEARAELYQAFENNAETISLKEIHKAEAEKSKEVLSYKRNDNIDQEERGDYIEETMDEFTAKVDHLKKSMNVDVIIDPDVETSRVLASNDPRVIVAGKPIILINPNRVFKTTAIHEFGHIFIDSLPNGMKNPRLQKALSEIKDTPLWEEVKALYPDLSEDMLAKEAIVTAIGRKGSEIWDDAMKASAWERFKEWFFNLVSRIFPIRTSEVEKLTRELLDVNPKENLVENLSDISQEERAPRFIKDLKKEEAKNNIAYKDILSTIKNLHSLNKPKGYKERKAEYEARSTGKKTVFSELSDLKNALEKFNSADNQKGLFAYVRWANEGIDNLIEEIRDSKNKVELNVDLINKFKNFSSSYSLIDDVEKIIISEYDKGNMSEGRKDVFIKAVSEVKRKNEVAQNELLVAQRHAYANIMADNASEHLVEWRAKFEKDWETIQPQTPKEEWVNKKMADNADEIRQSAYEEYLDRAEKSFSDINAMAGRFLTEKNISSEEVQIVSKMISNATTNVRRFANKKAIEFKESYKKFSSKYSGSSSKSRYDKFIEQTDSGSYLTSMYSPEFLKEYEKMKDIKGNKDTQIKLYGDVKVSSDGTYTLDGKSKKITVPGKNMQVQGEFVNYEYNKKTITIPLHRAIANTEYNAWTKENFKRVKKGAGSITTPADKWLSEKYKSLTSEDKAQLEEFKKYIRDAETLYGGRNSLIESGASNKWYRLPGVTKSTLARIMEGNIKSATIDKVTDLFKVKADEDEYRNKKVDKDSARVFADVNNKEKYNIPVPYRSKLSKDEQSLDLHTILLMNLEAAKNFSEKSALENQVNTIVDVMANRNVPRYDGISMVRKLHGFSKDEDIQLYKDKNELPEDAKKIIDMMENRIYGIKHKSAGEVAGVDINKASGTLMKYLGSVSLIGNFINSIVNATTGTVNNLIEAIGGEHYTLKDWKVAGLKYWKDRRDIIGDIGSSVQTSKTNMLMNLFNVLGDSRSLNHNFEDNRLYKGLYSSHSLRPLAQGGEHMMQAKVMYALLNNIKVLNSKGEYLDKNGNVVSDKNKAASLDEVLILNSEESDVIGSLPDWVKATTFTKQGGHDNIINETTNLIKKKIIDLHGNYDSDLQSAAQREWWGKLLFFLRKWIESTTLRRWRGLPHALKSSDELRSVDKFYSEDYKSDQEGYYVTAVRFLRHAFWPAIKEFNFNVIKSHYDSKITAHEKANIRRMGAELSMMAITLLAYVAMGGMDDEPDEETLLARYYLRRELSELTFYANPLEAFKIASSPSATINGSQRVLKVFTQAFSDLGGTLFGDGPERYKQGDNKGEMKLWIRTLKSLPLFSQLEKDYEASLRFLQVMD